MLLSANLIIFVIIVSCAAFQYKKGAIVKSIATLIAVIIATIAAFGYFEFLADQFISRSGESSFKALVPWAPALSFILVFVVVFAILQTAATSLARQPIDLGAMPEQVIRVTCGLLTGVFLSSNLFTALALSPFSGSYPYQRFDKTDCDAQSVPQKPLLGLDEFSSRLFASISGGSLSGSRSFGVVHADFLNQVYLNRLAKADEVILCTFEPVLEVYKIKNKTTVWRVIGQLTDADRVEQQVKAKSGNVLMAARIGLKNDTSLDTPFKFSFSQIRVICKERSVADKPLSGKGITVYPKGMLKGEGVLQRIGRLNDVVEFNNQGVDEQGIGWVDYVFEIPNTFVPVLAEFQCNRVVQIDSVVEGELVPKAISPFFTYPVIAPVETNAERETRRESGE